MAKRGPKGVTVQEFATFLEYLSEYGNVSRAAKSAGISRMTLYSRKKDDKEFCKAWDNAAEIGNRALEDEARRRAYEGVDEPVVYKGELMRDDYIDEETGEIVRGNPLTIKKYSDTLLMFLLKGNDPNKFKERSGLEVSGPDGGPVQNKIEVHFVKSDHKPV